MEHQKPRRAAIYTRVSTSDQTCENQLLCLRELAENAGFQLVEEYVDTASGTTSSRSGMDQMMKDAARRRFDILLVWDVSRLSRSITQLINLFEELQALKVDLILSQHGVDTTTPAGRMVMQMNAVFAEFERAMIVERTKAGMARARAAGKRIGRPPASPALVAAIRQLRAKGMGMDAVARELKCGKSLSLRVCREFDAEQQQQETQT